MSKIESLHRERLHKRLDQFLDTLEEKMKDKIPTLDELAEEIFSMRQELTDFLTEEMLKKINAHLLEQKVAQYPHCGEILLARGPHERTVQTMIGKVKLKRPYFYCEACQKGFYPLDKALLLYLQEIQATTKIKY